MPTLGNFVKVDTSECLIEGCPQGHTPYHWSFDKRVGKLEVNFRDMYRHHKEHDPVPDLFDTPITCSECGEIICTWEEMIFQREHYWGVCFDGEHSRFASWELRDMGIDLSQSVAEAIGEPVLAMATS